MNCDARIRPFPNVTEVVCELDDEHPEMHEGAVRDYAYPGSVTVVEWADEDRRSFRGEWPGPCPVLVGCFLPAGHRGSHAL